MGSMQQSMLTLYPSGQTLDTYSTLGKKIEGQNSTFFHHAGTEYHFTRNSFFPQVTNKYY
jgi:hypothetical protein